MDNTLVDNMVLAATNKGTNKYSLLALLSQSSGLSLSTPEEKKQLENMLRNSRRRLARAGNAVVVIPTMFTGCTHPEQMNKAFIQSCEDVYFHIQQEVDSLMENYYDTGSESASVVRTSVRNTLGKALGFVSCDVERLFEINHKAVELLTKKSDEESIN